ncbi:hypothetical protein CYMTET_32951, partial [Cymbomonas tetramitiformis]
MTSGLRKYKQMPGADDCIISSGTEAKTHRVGRQVRHSQGDDVFQERLATLREKEWRGPRPISCSGMPRNMSERSRSDPMNSQLELEHVLSGRARAESGRRVTSNSFMRSLARNAPSTWFSAVSSSLSNCKTKSSFEDGALQVEGSLYKCDDKGVALPSIQRNDNQSMDSAAGENMADLLKPADQAKFVEFLEFLDKLFPASPHLKTKLRAMTSSRNQRLTAGLAQHRLWYDAVFIDRSPAGLDEVWCLAKWLQSQFQRLGFDGSSARARASSARLARGDEEGERSHSSVHFHFRGELEELSQLGMSKPSLQPALEQRVKACSQCVYELCRQVSISLSTHSLERGWLLAYLWQTLTTIVLELNSENNRLHREMTNSEKYKTQAASYEERLERQQQELEMQKSLAEAQRARHVEELKEQRESSLHDHENLHKYKAEIQRLTSEVSQLQAESSQSGESIEQLTSENQTLSEENRQLKACHAPPSTMPLGSWVTGRRGAVEQEKLNRLEQASRSQHQEAEEQSRRLEEAAEAMAKLSKENGQLQKKLKQAESTLRAQRSAASGEAACPHIPSSPVRGTSASHQGAPRLVSAKVTKPSTATFAAPIKPHPPSASPAEPPTSRMPALDLTTCLRELKREESNSAASSQAKQASQQEDCQWERCAEPTGDGPCSIVKEGNQEEDEEAAVAETDESNPLLKLHPHPLVVTDSTDVYTRFNGAWFCDACQ